MSSNEEGPKEVLLILTVTVTTCFVGGTVFTLQKSSITLATGSINSFFPLKWMNVWKRSMGEAEA